MSGSIEAGIQIQKFDGGFEGREWGNGGRDGYFGGFPCDTKCEGREKQRRDDRAESMSSRVCLLGHH